LSDSEIADKIREETGAQGRVPLSAVEQVRNQRQAQREARREARTELREGFASEFEDTEPGDVPVESTDNGFQVQQSFAEQVQKRQLRRQVASENPGITEEEISVEETENGFETRVDPEVNVVQGVEGVDDDLLNAALPETQTSEIKDFEQALAEAGPEVRQEFDDVIRDFEDKRQEFKEGVSETFTEADPESVASSTEELLEITNELDSEDTEQDLEEFEEEAESERQVEVAEDLVNSAADAFDEDSIDTAVGNIDQDADEVTAVAEEIARDEEEVDRLEEQVRQRIQNQELGLQQQDTEADTGFEAPGPEVRQATRELREQVREDTGLERGEVRIDQTTAEDGTVRLEARPADGATVTQPAQDNPGGSEDNGLSPAEEIDALLPDDVAVGSEPSAANRVVSNFESAGENVLEGDIEQAGEDTTQAGLAVMEVGSESGDRFAAETPELTGSAIETAGQASGIREVENFGEDLETATEQAQSGVATVGTQLGGFAIAGGGAAANLGAEATEDPVETVEDLGRGTSRFVGMTGSQLSGDPVGFLSEEAGEEAGEVAVGALVAGPAGAAVGSIPTPEIEVETPQSLQTSAAFARGELGTRVENQIVTTNSRLQEPAEEDGIDPEVAVSQIESEVDDSGRRITEVVTIDQRDRVIAQGRRTETPVSRREFLRERTGLDSVEASDVVPDFSLTGTSRGSLQIPTSSRTTDPEPEPEPEPENEPLTREQVREQASSELRNADTLQPESPLPETLQPADTFTTPTPRFEQVQSPIQSPVQEPFETPFTTQRPDTTPEVREETTLRPDQRTEVVPEQEQTPFIEQVPEQETVIEQERRPEPEPEPEPEPDRTPSPDFGLGEEEDEEEELFGFGQEDEEGDGEFTTSLVGESFGVGVTDEEAEGDTLTGLEGRIR